LKHFWGTYFDPALPDGRTQVALTFTDQGVEFRIHERTEYWSSNEVSVSFGGSSQHLLFFTSKANPEVCFYVPWDPELKLYFKSRAPAQWKAAISKDRRREQFGQWVTGVLIAFLVAGIVALIYFRSALSSPVVSLIPYSVEEAIGEQFLKSVLPVHARLKDAELLRTLEKTLVPLRLALPKKFQDFKVYISNDPDLNAFALPGGYIIFNLGTLRTVKDASELLGVAAHELTHVTERHSMRNVVEGAGLFLVVQTLLGDLTGLIAVAADQGSFLLSRSFSRDMEEEADKKGIDLLLEARIDPRGMARFFESLIDERNKLGDTFSQAEKALQFLSTHPYTASRVQNIESRYQALGEDLKHKLQSDTPEFKKMKEHLSKTDKDKHE
jgi:predicted Zn-dependent protease